VPLFQARRTIRKGQRKSVRGYDYNEMLHVNLCHFGNKGERWSHAEKDIQVILP